MLMDRIYEMVFHGWAEISEEVMYVELNIIELI